MVNLGSWWRFHVERQKDEEEQVWKQDPVSLPLNSLFASTERGTTEEKTSGETDGKHVKDKMVSNMIWSSKRQ